MSKFKVGDRVCFNGKKYYVNEIYKNYMICMSSGYRAGMFIREAKPIIKIKNGVIYDL